MIQLGVLGGVSLTGNGGEEMVSLLSHPKRMAVLSYLSLAASNGFVSRDSLAALFWPEADETRARNALSQVLHALRSELGEEVILARGRREVGVNRAELSCDALDFLGAIRAGGHEQALDLYGGHFLEGFHVGSGAAFDSWLSEERGRLREMAAGAAWAVAHRHLLSGRLVEAERTAQRALGLVCTDESEVRRFIATLAAAGDRAGAIQFFERFRTLLSRELELEPGPRTLELVQRLRDDPAIALTMGSPPNVSDDPGLPPERGREEGEGEGDPRRWLGGRLLPWALACLAGGWASSEAATLMIARFNWPEPVGQVASLLVVMAAFGFFFALILAFYFGEKARGQATGPELLVVAVVMLAIGAVLARVGSRDLFSGWVGPEFRPAPTVEGLPVTVVAFPWTVSAGAGDQDLPLGDIRTEMIQRLSRDPRLRIVPWEALSPDGAPPPDLDDPGELGGAQYILVVSARLGGGDLSLTARLLSPGREDPLWTGEVGRRGGVGSYPGMGEEIAEGLLGGMGELMPVGA